MQFEYHKEKVVKPNEPIVFENKTESAFSVGAGLVFRHDGEYVVSVRNNKVVVRNYGDRFKEGAWINHHNDKGFNTANCSKCGEALHWFDEDKIPRFCPMCGSYNKEVF